MSVRGWHIISKAQTTCQGGYGFGGVERRRQGVGINLRGCDEPARVERAAIVPAASFLTTSALAVRAHTLIYKVLSNAEVAWRQALVGAVVAALLSVVGLSLVKLYLSTGRFASALEAAGAAAVLLMGFYYLGQMFVLGALVIRVRASMSGSELVPREEPSRSASGSPEGASR